MDSLRAHPYLVFLHVGSDRLDEARHPGSALRLALRLAATAYSAETGCVVARSATRSDLVLRAALPKDAAFEPDDYPPFLGKRGPPMPVAVRSAPAPQPSGLGGVGPAPAPGLQPRRAPGLPEGDAARRSRSTVAGAKRPLSEAVVQVLERVEFLGFDRVDGQWLAWVQVPEDQLAAPVPELLAVIPSPARRRHEPRH